MSHAPPLKKYAKRSIGQIHDYIGFNGLVTFAPLPNFHERSVGHEAITYCRYWFDADFSIKKVSMKDVLDTIGDVPSRTYVVVVSTQRQERVIHTRADLEELLALCAFPPTACFQVMSPHAHNCYIELVIYRGVSPFDHASDQPHPAAINASSTAVSTAALHDPAFEVSPDELANDMPDPVGGNFFEDAEHFFGRSVPTRWTPFMDQAEAPKHYKFTWGWR